MTKVITSVNFEKEAKRMIRKYRSLSYEIATLIESLSENATLGTAIGKDCYKSGWR